MEMFELHTIATTEEGEEIWLTYCVTESNGRYGLACWVEGVDLALHPYDFAKAPELFATVEKAEKLAERLVKSQVMPAHMVDLVEELR